MALIISTRIGWTLFLNIHKFSTIIQNNAAHIKHPSSISPAGIYGGSESRKFAVFVAWLQGSDILPSEFPRHVEANSSSGLSISTGAVTTISFFWDQSRLIVSQQYDQKIEQSAGSLLEKQF